MLSLRMRRKCRTRSGPSGGPTGRAEDSTEPGKSYLSPGSKRQPNTERMGSGEDKVREKPSHVSFWDKIPSRGIS